MEPCEAQDYAIRSRVAVDRTMRPGNWLVDKLRLNHATDIYVLLHDEADDSWSVWKTTARRQTFGGLNCALIHWDGDVDKVHIDAPWMAFGAKRLQAYLISREQAETLTMLARHMREPMAWHNAAARYASRHGGQMVRCTHD